MTAGVSKGPNAFLFKGLETTLDIHLMASGDGLPCSTRGNIFGIGSVCVRYMIWYDMI